MEVRRTWGPFSGGGTGYGRPASAHEEIRPAKRSAVVATGTLACRGCDAPVSIGSSARSLTEELTCPYCGEAGPLRDFLSLALPTRPARVVIRLSSVG
jgi:hypothetical protein